MPTKATRFLAIALLLLTLAGAIVSQMKCPPAAESAEASNSRGRWIHPKFVESVNRRMQSQHRRIMTKWPAKRKVCSCGPSEVCDGPILVDDLPLPVLFGSSAVHGIKLPVNFQVVR